MTTRPAWLRIKAPSPQGAAGMRVIRDVLDRYSLTTVCQGAICPNAAECWSKQTATFMLLGKVCTRACRFCAVPTGNPKGAVDWEEPNRLAAAVRELGLSYVVLTSVDRDDLTDGGASVFAAAIKTIKERHSAARVEALVPDFSGNEEAIATVAAANPDGIGHNLETVRRLTPTLRDRRADYDRSLQVLAQFKKRSSDSLLKSSLILGLGERREEVLTALGDLRRVGVDAVTLGQYLQPTPHAAPVARYLSPAEFDELAEAAQDMGFRSVLSGPLVRSSYHAAELFRGCTPYRLE
jgi:lipoic acid synthetase